MKKLLTLTAVALMLPLAGPATARADARIDLSAHGGIGAGAMPTMDNEHALVSLGFQMTWDTTPWLKLGIRQNISVALNKDWSDAENMKVMDPFPLFHSYLVARVHMGSRVRATLGSGIGVVSFIPGPALMADLEVVLVRQGKHELSLRAGGDFVAMIFVVPYMSARGGLAWSF